MKRPGEIPGMRKEGKYYLLFKPAAQISLVALWSEPQVKKVS